MTAAAKDVKTAQFGSTDEVYPGLLNYPVEANTILYAGTMAAANAAGNAVPASANTALKLIGRVERQIDNRTSNVPFGAAGDQSVQVKAGVFFFSNAAGANAVGVANLFKYCYAADDNTVSAGAQAGTLPLAGVVVALGSKVSPSVDTGKIAVWVGGATPYDVNPLLAAASGAAFKARNIAAAGNVASLAAFTVAGNDGVTNVAGDIVVLLEQTTAAQNGPYVVGTVAAGAAPLTRPDWWPTGTTLLSSVQIDLGSEGTIFKGITLRPRLNAASFVVGTTDPALYPDSVSGATALVAGTFTISTVPVFSANTAIHLSRKIANTSTATTGGYHATVAGATGITIGVRGTAEIVIEATVAAGTINNADISTLHWTIINQAS